MKTPDELNASIKTGSDDLVVTFVRSSLEVLMKFAK